MEFEINKENLKNPKSRAIIGILLIIFGIAALLSQNYIAGITRDDCKEMTAVFEKCEYNSNYSTHNTHRSGRYYLTFANDDTRYDIDPSCETKALIDAVQSLPSGTTVTMLVNNKNSTIYELEVNGKILLDFEYASSKIDTVAVIFRYAGYASLAGGSICMLSLIVTLVKKLQQKKQQ